MAKYGLDSYSYHLHLAETGSDAFWFLDRVLELGLDGCQFDPMHLDNWNVDLIERIASFCREHGLYLELGSGGFEFDHLAPRIELAGRAGARSVRTFVSWNRA